MFTNLYGQRYAPKFDSLMLSKTNINYFDRVMNAAKSGNSMSFLYLGYNINARNTMFKATKNLKYLQQNQEIILAIIEAGRNDNTDKGLTLSWRANSSSPKDRIVVGKEVMLYEGYLFRYVSEYCYILKSLNGRTQLTDNLPFMIEAVEFTWEKWYKRLSMTDNIISGMIGIRAHIGSHWATTSMYMFKLSKDSKRKKSYEKLFKIYDRSLKNNLKIKFDRDTEYYLWNSTWDIEPYTNHDKIRRKAVAPTLIQDVAHGNHVIQYIIDSYNLSLNEWTLDDIKRLSNTLKIKIWSEKNMSFSDNIDGSISEIEEGKQTGWKQSDGWMKLIFYNRDLSKIYKGYYASNMIFLDKTYYNLQFLANLEYFNFLTQNARY